MPVFLHDRGTLRQPGTVRPALPDAVHLAWQNCRMAQSPGRVHAGSSGQPAEGRRFLREVGRTAEAAGVRGRGGFQLPQGRGRCGKRCLHSCGYGRKAGTAADLPAWWLHGRLCHGLRGCRGYLPRSGEPRWRGHRAGGEGQRQHDAGSVDSAPPRRGRFAAAWSGWGSGADLCRS